MGLRTLIGAMTCLAGTLLPASDAQAGPLSRLFHHGKACPQPQAVCNYYGWYNDGSGQLKYGLLTRMSDGSTVVAGQPPMLSADGASFSPEPDPEIAELKRQIQVLTNNLTAVTGTANAANATATTANTTATKADTTANAADTKADNVKSDLQKQLDDLKTKNSLK